MGKATSRRKPDNLKPVKTMQEVDDALFQIAQYRIKLKKIDAEAEAQINIIKENAAREAEPIKAEIEKLENGIFAFAEFNKDDLFSKKKSVELNFGLLGYRKSTKISIKKTTLEKLKAAGLLDAIIVRESPNKEVLATYPDETLKAVDAKRITEDNFWYEVKETAVTQHAAKQVS
jgi:phage host-nuclease inhibitor protein Gam